MLNTYSQFCWSYGSSVYSFYCILSRREIMVVLNLRIYARVSVRVSARALPEIEIEIEFEFEFVFVFVFEFDFVFVSRLCPCSCLWVFLFFYSIFNVYITKFRYLTFQVMTDFQLLILTEQFTWTQDMMMITSVSHLVTRTALLFMLLSGKRPNKYIGMKILSAQLEVLVFNSRYLSKLLFVSRAFTNVYSMCKITYLPVKQISDALLNKCWRRSDHSLRTYCANQIWGKDLWR